MPFFEPILIAFTLIFLSELGDKTQLLVLSFSSKLKTATILLGVSLGSFLSHGIAILFGSALGNFQNTYIQNFLQIFSYFSFILIGCISLFSKNSNESDGKSKILSKISNLKLNYILIIAFTIAIGELGDKTFLASIGLGIQYPNFKFLLILGAILGMIISDLIAIVLGKFLSKKISSNAIEKISSALFILFGLVGLFLHFNE